VERFGECLETAGNDDARSDPAELGAGAGPGAFSYGFIPPGLCSGKSQTP
jgi:hypothetical protein